MIETLHRIGTPYEEIVKVAKEMEVDLIVIATHGYTGLRHFLLGSTTERVVNLAPCPVLVVRQKERDFILKKASEIARNYPGVKHGPPKSDGVKDSHSSQMLISVLSNRQVL